MFSAYGRTCQEEKARTQHSEPRAPPMPEVFDKGERNQTIKRSSQHNKRSRRMQEKLASNVRRFGVLTFILSAPIIRAQIGNSREYEILETIFQSCNGPEWNINNNWLNPEVGICEWYGVVCGPDDGVTGLRLRSNNIQCTIPAELFSLSELAVIDFSNNPNLDISFSAVENEVLEKIHSINLNDSGITSISGFDTAIGTNLQILGLGANSLVGQFPKEIKNFTNLEYLDLSYNFFTGTLPEEIGTLTSLVSLSVTENFLQGQIPESITNMKNITILDLSNNGLSGRIPDGINSLNHLSIFSVYNQKVSDGVGLTGPILDFSKMPDLSWVDLAENDFSGTIPQTFLASVSRVDSRATMIDLSSNHLTGTVPSELSRFEVLQIFLSKNNLVSIAPELCAKNDWFQGQIGKYGCSALLCPRGTVGAYGRQVSTTLQCLPCPGGMESAPFLGSSECLPLGSEQMIKNSDFLSLSSNAPSRTPTEIPSILNEPDPTVVQSDVNKVLNTSNDYGKTKTRNKDTAPPSSTPVATISPVPSSANNGSPSSTKQYSSLRHTNEFSTDVKSREDTSDNVSAKSMTISESETYNTLTQTGDDVFSAGSTQKRTLSVYTGIMIQVGLAVIFFALP